MAAPLPRAALAALLASSCLPACAVIEELGLTRPSLALRDVRVDEFGLQGSTLVFDVEVRNPYGVPLPLADWSYSLASGAQPFLAGSAELEGSVPARGARTLALPVRIDYPALLGVLSEARPGRSVPWDAELTLAVDVPGGEPFTVPFQRSGALPVPALPAVDLAGIRWDQVGLAGVSGTVVLAIDNPNDFGFDLAQLALGLELGGRPLATLAAQPGATFAAETAGTLELPISLSTAELGLGLLETLRGSSASYRLQGDLELGTPFGPLAFPLERVGRTQLSGS